MICARVLRAVNNKNRDSNVHKQVDLQKLIDFMVSFIESGGARTSLNSADNHQAHVIRLLSSLDKALDIFDDLIANLLDVAAGRDQQLL